MLVLTRKENQAIVIAGQITIRIFQTKHSGVRLGIEAPREVAIRRAELPPREIHREDAETDLKEIDRKIATTGA